MKSVKKCIQFLPLLLLLLCASSVLFGTDLVISADEKRPLAARPEISAASVLDGSYMKELETWMNDQFPLRDTLRGIRANTETRILGKSDSSGYYIAEGGIYKLEAELKEKNIVRAAQSFAAIADSYFPESDVYYAIIPDKSDYLDAPGDYPRLDYGEIESLMTEHMAGASYIPLSDTLTKGDYYNTDPHWRQEKIQRTADRLLDVMRAVQKTHVEGQEKSVKTAVSSFRGSYAGASGFFDGAVEPDALCYLTSELTEQAVFYDYEEDEKTTLYEIPDALSGDPYDFFLRGPRALLSVENPAAPPDGKTLVLFRDSFGSSIAPLLLDGYRRILLIDLRYVPADYALSLADVADGADVLFLYCASMLNHSDSMRFCP